MGVIGMKWAIRSCHSGSPEKKTGIPYKPQMAPGVKSEENTVGSMPYSNA